MTQAPRYLKTINRSPGMVADFIPRISGVAVDTDRESTVARLEPAHRERILGLGFDWENLVRAEQIHGGDCQIVGSAETGSTIPAVDGLITASSDVLLGIYVADCGAVFLADPVKRVIALLHSGKKGTESNITGRAIEMMVENFGCEPENLYAALAPCIRPPAYEVDFAATIHRQLLDAGVCEENFCDSGICTSSDLDSYYSYRQELGATGRMLALLGMREEG